MIQALLSAFKTYPHSHCSLSKTGVRNESLATNLNYFYSYKILLGFTMGTIVYHLYSFHYLKFRPIELFHQTHWFGKIFMPEYPSDELFFTVGGIAVVMVLVLLFAIENTILKLLLSFSLMWLLLFRWSFGGQGHSTHLLILAHLLSIFIISKDSVQNPEDGTVQKSIEWVYLGLFFTYVLAGGLKLIALIYKLIFKPDDLHWLHSKAALYNSVFGFYGSDMHYRHMIKWFSLPIFWQISFLVTCYVLTFSFLAAFRRPLRIWVAIVILLFHGVNNIFFNVEFYTPICVAFILFFPYERFIGRIRAGKIPVKETMQAGKGKEMVYKRIYANNDVDIFQGFYAYRERAVDRHPFWGGLLFLPFFDQVMMSYWRITRFIRPTSVEREKK